jgi:putative lipoprotein
MTSRRPVAFAVLFALGLASASAKASEADPWFGRDKALHFGLSAAIAVGGYGVGSALSDDYAPRAAVAGGLAFGAGVGKEIVDLAGYGDPSWRDLTWDLVGSLVGVGLSLAVDAALRGSHPAAAH